MRIYVQLASINELIDWLTRGGVSVVVCLLNVRVLGLRRARRSRIVWRIVFSLLTKKSESILHSFWLSIASKLLSRSWLGSSSCAMRHLLRASLPDSVNFLLMYSRRERLISRFVAWQAERYLIWSWSDFVRLYRHSSCLRFRLAPTAILENQLFVCWLRRWVTCFSCASSLRTAVTSSRSWTAYSFVVALGRSQILLVCSLLMNWLMSLSWNLRYWYSTKVGRVMETLSTALTTEWSDTPRSWMDGADLRTDELTGVIIKSKRAPYLYVGSLTSCCKLWPAKMSVRC